MKYLTAGYIPVQSKSWILSLPWKLCHVISSDHTLLNVHSGSPLRPCACWWFLASTAASQSPPVLFSSASMQHKHRPSFPIVLTSLSSSGFRACPKRSDSDPGFCSGAVAADRSRQGQPLVHRLCVHSHRLEPCSPKDEFCFLSPPNPLRSLSLVQAGMRLERYQSTSGMKAGVGTEQSISCLTWFKQVNLGLRR